MPPSARRSTILTAAERLFRHYGPAKTTMADIAREAGIGVGSLYIDFSSKDAIVSELAHDRHGRVLVAMRAVSDRGSSADRLAKMLEVRVLTLLELADGGAHACDMVLCPSTAVEGAYGKFRQQELALVSAVLRHGAACGEFAVSAPERTAELILRCYATLSPPWLFQCERASVLPLVRAMNALLIQGLLTRSTAAPSRARRLQAAPRRQRNG